SCATSPRGRPSATPPPWPIPPWWLGSRTSTARRSRGGGGSREEQERDAGEQRGQDEPAVAHVAEETGQWNAGLLGEGRHREVGGAADIGTGPHGDGAKAERGEDGVGDAHHLVAEAEALAEREKREIGRRIVEKRRHRACRPEKLPCLADPQFAPARPEQLQR